MPNNFQPSTWFVTGATGLVGSYVVEQLREVDLSVLALVRDSSPKHMIKFVEDTGAKIIFGDLLNPNSYKDFLPTCDVIVHTAAAVQIRDKDVNWNVNFKGTEMLIKTMEKYSVKRLIHISTTGVYGDPSGVLVDEDVTPKPFGPYLESKLATDRLILEFKENISPTIIRPPFIFGEGDRDRHVLPTIIQRFPSKFMAKIWRHNPKLGFVHAEDIAKLVLLAGSNPKTESKIYNVQSMEIHLDELISMVKNVKKTNTRIFPFPYSVVFIIASFVDIWFRIKRNPIWLRRKIKFAKYNWSFSTKKAETELGWTAMHREPKELEVLLEDFYNVVNGKNTAVDMRDLFEQEG